MHRRVVVLVMTDGRAEEAVRGWIAATNAHDLDAYAKCIADDYTWDLWEATTTGKALSLEAWRILWEGIPDLRIDADGIFSDTGHVAIRFRMHGTQKGPLRFRGTASWDTPLPPTGRTFEVRGAGLFETRSGLVTRSSAFWQPAVMLRQLGHGSP